MKILYLPAYFYPEQAASAYLSDNRNQAFADAGFDMVVYTPVPTRGISIEERKKYKHRKADSMYGGRMIVYRFSLMREGGGPIVRALRYSLSCIRQFYWGCFAQEARQCDVMFISSTPPIQGAMAALIKKIRRIPLVYSLQDIFPDSLVGTGMAKKGGALWKVGRMIEDFTYRNADRIIVMNEGEINGIGTHEELLAGNDIYREVYESQNGAGANADFDDEAPVATKEVNQHA